MQKVVVDITNNSCKCQIVAISRKLVGYKTQFSSSARVYMFNRLRLQLYLLTYLLLMDYLFMVMMFQFNSQEGIIYIHSQVENHLEIRLMEDH
jgi:hypothetical protein